jgi:hypothetical protein
MWKAFGKRYAKAVMPIDNVFFAGGIHVSGDDNKCLGPEGITTAVPE